ncbi:MAG: nitrite reductase (NAD(P)H) small subunit [Acidobacteria bacterium]|nr:nitrite reductase (NAD(P)H) small subunit [Acidobacteriota bacterium]MCI0620902.1 nitrite reductase (NAD(P)H) small subunit [Acidobacteriota bacterium]MCI0720366.1 nitrite reductase (NAD(P)H) small subunit [Acidobacteriota bacterium]
MSYKASENVTYSLGPASQIPVGEGKAFQVGELQVAVFRSRDGRLFSTQAFCPHKHGLLADGIIGAGRVICPLHSYKFDLETGKPVGNDCKALQTYRVELSENGNLQLHLEIVEGY